MTIGADAITFIVRDLICAISLCSCICVTGQLWNMSVELLVAVHIRLFVERAFSCLRKNDNEESFFLVTSGKDFCCSSHHTLSHA